MGILVFVAFMLGEFVLLCDVLGVLNSSLQKENTL